MTRKQIRVFVDADEWNVLSADAGTSDDKDIQAYLMRFYSVLSQLKTINPDPIVAVGVAIANYQTLAYMQGYRQASIPPVEQRVAQPIAQPFVSSAAEPTRPLVEELQNEPETLPDDNASDF